MNFLDLAKIRCSTRDYQSKKVEPQKLHELLAAAQVAPTAANLQPVRLIVVQEQAGLDKIGKAANIFHAPLAIIVCADRSKAWTRPFDGMNTAQIDASILTDHMMLAATDQGLASLWICYFKPDVLKQEFNLPESLEPVNILAVGYSSGPPTSPDRHSTSRIPLAELVHYESI